MPERRRGRPRHPDLLTPAERRVLEELRKGGTNAEIAVRIGIGPETVKTHVSNMLAKLDLDDRQQLAAWREEDAPRRRRWLLAPFLLRPLVAAGVVAGVAVVVIVVLVLLALVGGDGHDTTLAVEVSVGADHTCALRASGGILCWGNDGHGQLKAPPGRFRSVSAGWGHTCAIHESGKLQCWGRNWEGQTDVPPGVYSSVSAGQWHTCALLSSGEALCWGANHFGQSDAPPGRYRAVAAGSYHTCALDESSGPVCWGDNRKSQADPPAELFRSITVGQWHTCGVRTVGRVVCWGNIQMESDSGTPHTWIGTGQSLTCVDYRRQVYCLDTDWLASMTHEGCTLDGNIWFAEVECGAGDVIGILQSSITRTDLRHLSVSVGKSHACGLTESGAVECWGPEGSPSVDVPEALRAPELTE